MIDKESLEDLKSICEDLGHPCTDEEALKIGARIIQYLRASEGFSVRKLPELSPQEQKAYAFIRTVQPAPSIRKITEHIGFSSSRSRYGRKLWTVGAEKCASCG